MGRRNRGSSLHRRRVITLDRSLMPVVGHLLYLFSRLYTRASALAERIDVTKSSGDKCGDGA